MGEELQGRRTKGSVVYPTVLDALAKLGGDISLARRSRRVRAADFARSMGVSQATLHRLERGDPGVSLNTLAMALNALGRLDLLSGLVDQAKDDVGLAVARGEVPMRVRRPRPKPGDPSAATGGPITSDGGVEGW
jgi:transcriptional regulator with XRE-family HTH domain